MFGEGGPCQLGSWDPMGNPPRSLRSHSFPAGALWSLLAPRGAICVTAAMLASFVVDGSGCRGSSVQRKEVLGLVGMPSPMPHVTKWLCSCLPHRKKTALLQCYIYDDLCSLSSF